MLVFVVVWLCVVAGLCFGLLFHVCVVVVGLCLLLLVSVFGVGFVVVVVG